MKPFHYYLIAALLLVGSMPIYHSILTHRSGDSVIASPVSPPLPSSPHSPTHSIQPEAVAYSCEKEPDAPPCVLERAAREGRAKCVAGVVYRTYDHVIEPWPPGNIRCSQWKTPPL